MWIIQVEDGLQQQSTVLPTAAVNRESTEPLMVDVVEKWAALHHIDLDKYDVHCCTGEEHNHDPLVVVRERGEQGKMLLQILCYEITHVVHAEKLTEHTGVISVREVGEQVVPQAHHHAKTLH